MKISIDDFDRAIARYVDECVLPATKSDINRFTIGMLKGLGKLSSRSMLPQLESVGVYDSATNTIDTDVLRMALDGGFGATPTISFMGFKFDKNDANKFMEMI